MRRFHSYGPVDSEEHFCLERAELVDQCITQLVGNPEKGGHYFTLWAPRQTGKTWLMRRVKQELPWRYPDQFAVFDFSLGVLREPDPSPAAERDALGTPKELYKRLQEVLPGHPDVTDWKAFRELFSRERGLWDRPLVLLIDEIDTTPTALLDILVGQFREMYLDRSNNWLHGLALAGVRAVLGVDSRRGSPFNIQRSLRVPNFTAVEVKELYQQYQEESGQEIEAAVVDEVYRVTRGQPGLVSWFGELLTEKYNPIPSPPSKPVERAIDLETWELTWRKARFAEPNNTVMNLIAKAKMSEYQGFLMELFTRPDISFSFHHPLHNYLYLHGIIAPETTRMPSGELAEICRFTSPFVQESLYHALGRDVVGDRMPIPAVEPLDDLADVFAGASLDLPALLDRYKGYLSRLKAKGINPWKEQPRRKTDLHLAEAVGHFHLYAWLKEALGRRCVLSPEFPAGNGKVDLHLRCGDKRGIIEVKSFVDAYRATEARTEAAQYAASLGLEAVTVAMFVPLDDEVILDKLSVKEVVQGVQVTVVAIGWV
jgi:hypothetical protein